MALLYWVWIITSLFWFLKLYGAFVISVENDESLPNNWVRWAFLFVIGPVILTLHSAAWPLWFLYYSAKSVVKRRAAR